ncbi:MAG: hypothetical protein JW803_05070 [Endomicrobiales bacterium]|nr:hypothetical protein [Endomicrobiales bacterium]
MNGKKLFVLFAAVFVFSAGASSGTVQPFYSSSNGYGKGSSSSYGNTSNVGQLAGDSLSLNYRSYGGYLASQVVVIDFSMTFFDESPAASEWQETTDVTARVTVYVSTGNTIASVKYRISNSGPDESSFFAWQSDAVVDTVIDATKTRYRVSIPNSAGQSLAEGENNYIQWQVTNNANSKAQSGIYRIRVRSNDAPSITITQPDAKSNFTSMSPRVEATITDEHGGVDAGSIGVGISRSNGTSVASLNSSGVPSIFDASTGKLSCTFTGVSLTADASYTLTVTASDTKGRSSSSTMTFIPKSGAIADLVPYPSPFDPKAEPIKIRYVLTKRSDVSIRIYDMSGRLVRSIVDNDVREAGLSEDEWRGINYAGEDMANGVYLCELVAKDEDGEHRSHTALAIFGK